MCEVRGELFLEVAPWHVDRRTPIRVAQQRRQLLAPAVDHDDDESEGTDLEHARDRRKVLRVGVPAEVADHRPGAAQSDHGEDLGTYGRDEHRETGAEEGAPHSRCLAVLLCRAQ